MKKFMLPLLILLLTTLTITAQEEQDPAMAEMQKAWTEFMTPGWAHELLAKSVGEWTYEQTFWMYPGTEPQVSEGTSSAEMIMGGRYLKSQFSGMSWGMPFQGMSIGGYDNEKEEFVMLWIDDMGTGFSLATGTYDEENKQIIYEGSMTDPMTGGDSWYKMIIQYTGDDSSVFEMYVKDAEGNEFKAMHSKYKRK